MNENKFQLNDIVIDTLGNDPQHYIVIRVLSVEEGFYYTLRAKYNMTITILNVPETHLTLMEDAIDNQYN